MVEDRKCIPGVKFLERNKLKKALLVTLDTETKFEKDSLLIEAIPYWKHWSIRASVVHKKEAGEIS